MDWPIFHRITKADILVVVVFLGCHRVQLVLRPNPHRAVELQLHKQAAAEYCLQHLSALELHGGVKRFNSSSLAALAIQHSCL